MRRSNPRRAIVDSFIEPLEHRVLLARLIGIDVSSYQGTITWSSVKNSKQFAVIRASTGLGNDSTFGTNMNGAIANGMYAGAYHYAYYSRNTTGSGTLDHTAAGEAGRFWNQIKNSFANDGKHLMPVLDVEEGTALGTGSGTTVSKWVTDFCTIIKNNAAAIGYDVTPMIYTGASNAGTLFDTTVPGKYPLWVAQWPGSLPDTQTGQPSGVGDWQSGTNYKAWAFWQYSSTGSVSGISGNVDLDVFQGDTNVIKDYVVKDLNGPVGRWAIGSRVQANNTLNVWNTGAADDVVLGTQSTAKGTIIDGPVYGGSFMRWNVNFDSGVDGWVGEYQSVNTTTLANIDWLITATPSAVSSPNPANNTVTNTLPASFTWTAGANATSYDVFLDGVKQTNVTSASWTHGAIANGAHTWRIDSKNAELTTTGSTWNFTFDTVAPTASYGAQTPAPGASTMDFTITYSDATSALNAGTFDSNDVTVTGPNGFSAAASFISATPSGNGTPRTVTYRIGAPGGTWNIADNGLYTVSQNAAQVSDTATNARPAGTIGTFTANVPFAWQSGGVVTLEYDASGLPLAIGTNGANITVAKDGTSLSFSGATSIAALGTSAADMLNINATLAIPITLNLGAGADVLNINSGTFTLASDAGAGTTNLTINVSSAILFSASQHLAALNLPGGAATLASGQDKVLMLQTLSATGNGALDLTDNSLIASGMSPESFAAMIESGYAAGAWTGPGIRSSTASTNPQNTLGWGQASAIMTLPGSFASQPVGGASILAGYTLLGDSNLDHLVDTGDFTALAQSFNATGQAYSNGDFNFDSNVNALDFNAIATHFGQALPAPAQALAAARTPNLFGDSFVSEETFLLS